MLQAFLEVMSERERWSRRRGSEEEQAGDDQPWPLSELNRTAMLATPQDLILRAGIQSTPRYEDVSPISDGVGFYAFRRYPANTELARIVTSDQRPAVRCYLAFIVAPPTEGGHISRIELKARLAPRWRSDWGFMSRRQFEEPAAGHPDAPNAASAAIVARTPRPIDLDQTDALGLIYDHHEDVFLDENGNAVDPVEVLDQLYTQHCRTLRVRFRIRWRIGSGARWAVRTAVWKGQDAALWMLFRLYDVELVGQKKELSFVFPFYKYKPSDFSRVTDTYAPSQFFGFQSSKKSFFTNMVFVVVAVLFLYWKGPRGGLLLTIYNNTALTTAALLFAFLLVDAAGPWLLVRIICWLSRLREVVMFVTRKVTGV